MSALSTARKSALSGANEAANNELIVALTSGNHDRYYYQPDYLSTQNMFLDGSVILGSNVYKDLDEKKRL